MAMRIVQRVLHNYMLLVKKKPCSLDNILTRSQVYQVLVDRKKDIWEYVERLSDVAFISRSPHRNSSHSKRTSATVLSGPTCVHGRRCEAASEAWEMFISITLVTDLLSSVRCPSGLLVELGVISVKVLECVADFADIFRDFESYFNAAATFC